MRFLDYFVKNEDNKFRYVLAVLFRVAPKQDRGSNRDVKRKVTSNKCIDKESRSFLDGRLVL